MMLASPRASPPKKLSPKAQPKTVSPSPGGGSMKSLSPRYTGRHSVLVALKKKELQLDDLWANEDSLTESDLDMSSLVKPANRNTDAGFLINSPLSQRSKRRATSIVYKRLDGSSVITDKSALEKELHDMEMRKSNISDSLLAFSLPESLLVEKPKKVRGPTINDLYGPNDSFRSEISALMVDESEFDIGEEPDSKRSVNYHDEDHSQTPSLYCDISVIKTSASDDQWAKYKLLGRVGMGEVRVSKPAKKLINKSIRVMAKAIKQVMALRDTDPIIISDPPTKPRSASCLTTSGDASVSRHTSISSGTASTTETAGTKADIFCTGKILDEFKQTVNILPPNKAQYKRDPNDIELPDMVKMQLKDYITVIASMYTDNAFHNFEHASEVLKSSNAILSFISMSKELDDLVEGPGSGVITDPWTHFALVFSALIHDVDHAGVPNAQLTKEKSIISDSYKGKSVAEQNSIEIAWNLLMEPCYKALREVLFTTAEEVSRFRRLVVIFVLATDIADQELAKFRKQRAQEAMACQESSTVAASGKATYIMETIMQAADVSHTMQPFHVYKKWNWKLYREMYTAFENGRAEKDPTETWYEGDIRFFDFYIIPLAKQLVTCGVMDESKVENLLNNARENREEWATHGKGMVEQYIKERSRPKETNMQRRGSMCDSVASGGSAVSDLTDYDDLSACSLLDTTFAKIPNCSQKVSTQSPGASKKKQRRASSKSPGKKNRSSLSSPKRTLRTKKKEKMVGPPPLLNDEEMGLAAEVMAKRHDTGESRTDKSRRSEGGPRRHSMDSPRKGRPSKRKSDSSSGKKTAVGSTRHSSADGRRGSTSRAGRKSDFAISSPQTLTKRRSKKSELSLTAPTPNATPSSGEIVLPIRTNRPKKHARSRSSGAADKEEVSMFLKRFHASREARSREASTSEPRQRCNSAPRPTRTSTTGDA